MTGCIYRYTVSKRLFSFDFDLLDTSFEYHDQNIVSSDIPTPGIWVTVPHKNMSSVTAYEVDQIYLSPFETNLSVPLNQLIALQRVSLKSGQTKTIHFNGKYEMLVIIDEDSQIKFEPGKYRLNAGGCSPNQRGVALGAPQPVSEEF